MTAAAPVAGSGEKLHDTYTVMTDAANGHWERTRAPDLGDYQLL
jgi:hypothetical protein